MLTHDGQTRSLAEWVDIADIPRHVFKDRLKDGWSMKRIMATTPRKKPAQVITINGVSKSLTTWCRDTGIGRGKARYRLARGHSPESIFATP